MASVGGIEFLNPHFPPAFVAGQFNGGWRRDALRKIFTGLFFENVQEVEQRLRGQRGSLGRRRRILLEIPGSRPGPEPTADDPPPRLRRIRNEPRPSRAGIGSYAPESCLATCRAAS